MDEILHEFLVQLVASLVLFITLPIVRYTMSKITMRYATMSSISIPRAKMMLKYLFSIINIIVIVCLIIIWGVDPQNLLIALSSIFGVIGVAMFAQWSILSNITSGMIIFFTMPLRIGDYIKVLDKDLPFEAQIEDIRAFHIHLKTIEGEKVVYPNSMLLQKGIVIVQQKDESY